MSWGCMMCMRTRGICEYLDLSSPNLTQRKCIDCVGRITSLTNSDSRNRLPTNFSICTVHSQLAVSWKEKLAFHHLGILRPCHQIFTITVLFCTSYPLALQCEGTKRDVFSISNSWMRGGPGCTRITSCCLAHLIHNDGQQALWNTLNSSLEDGAWVL